MDILEEAYLTLSGMMDIITVWTLSFLMLPYSVSNTAPSMTQVQLPITSSDIQMDLSNVEAEKLYSIDEKIKCHKCLGFGHITCQYPSPGHTNFHSVQFKNHQQSSP